MCAFVNTCLSAGDCSNPDSSGLVIDCVFVAGCLNDKTSSPAEHEILNSAVRSVLCISCWFVPSSLLHCCRGFPWLQVHLSHPSQWPAQWCWSLVKICMVCLLLALRLGPYLVAATCFRKHNVTILMHACLLPRAHTGRHIPQHNCTAAQSGKDSCPSVIDVLPFSRDAAPADPVCGFRR